MLHQGTAAGVMGMGMMRSRRMVTASPFAFLSAAVQEVNLLDREIQRNRKTNSEKQEENEKLTEELQMAQIQCEAIKRTINKKKDEEEALLAQYSSYKSSLKEAENTLLRLKKVVSVSPST